MTAKREAIFAWTDEQLASETSAVEIERMASADPSAFPSLNIEDGDQINDPDSEPGSNRYTLTIAIEGYVAGGDGAEAHAAASELYREVVSAMMVEPPCGGLAEEITEKRALFAVAVLADERRIGFVVEFDIVFVADRASPVA
jgi:hypothetical protein